MGNYLTSPIVDKSSTTGNNAGLHFAVSEMQGWRKSMEDAILCHIGLKGMPDAAVFGVFDGHGGSDVSRFVQANFVRAFESQMAFEKAEFELALCKTFIQLDEELLSDVATEFLNRTWVQPKPTYGSLFSGMRSGKKSAAVVSQTCGCTAIVACLVDKTLYVANVGDSRCVLCRGGKAMPLSEDHKPDMPTELERITEAGGYVQRGRVNGNLNLSRALGDHVYKQNSTLGADRQIISGAPDVVSIDLTAEDEFLVLACDGVWEMASSQALITWLRGQMLVNDENPNGSLVRVVESWLDYCLAPSLLEYCGLGCDNMTCIVVDLRNRHVVDLSQHDGGNTTRKGGCPSQENDSTSPDKSGDPPKQSRTSEFVDCRESSDGLTQSAESCSSGGADSCSPGGADECSPRPECEGTEAKWDKRDDDDVEMTTEDASEVVTAKKIDIE